MANSAPEQSDDDNLDTSGLREVELDIKIQEAIGSALKANYESMINAPIPERFLTLLSELEALELSGKTPASVEAPSKDVSLGHRK